MIGYGIHEGCCMEKQLRDANLRIAVEKENKLLGSLVTGSD